MRSKSMTVINSLKQKNGIAANAAHIVFMYHMSSQYHLRIMSLVKDLIISCKVVLEIAFGYQCFSKAGEWPKARGSS